MPKLIYSLLKGFGYFLWLMLLVILGATTLMFYLGLVVPGFNVITIVRFWDLTILAAGLAVFAVAFVAGRLRWLVSPQASRLYLWAAVLLVSFVILFYSVERWRGKRAWSNLVSELDGKAEKLSLESLIPPPVPDDQNFAATPLLADYFAAETAGEVKARIRAIAKFTELNMPPSPDDEMLLLERLYDEAAGQRGCWLSHRQVNLEAWQQYYCNLPSVQKPPDPQNPAADVLLALSELDDQIAELRQASQRPYARFNLPYHQGWFCDYSKLKVLEQVTRLLQLRAIAALHLAQPQSAFTDVQLSLQLADYMRQQPRVRPTHFLFKQMLLDSLQPIWEGLVMHRWSSAHLAVIEQRLSSLDMLTGYLETARSEAIMHMDFWDQLFPATSRRALPTALSEGELTERLAWQLCRLVYPDGWSWQNQAGMYRVYQENIVPLVDPAKQRVYVQSSRTAQRRISGNPTSLDPIMVTFVTPRIAAIADDLLCEFAHAQTVVNEARLACALERYWLSQGKYPDTLDALAPAFIESLPRDIITGQPLKYRRTDQGQFILYSLGWNEVDDSGKTVFEHDMPSRPPKLNQGDWVWRRPEAND